VIEVIGQPEATRLLTAAASAPRHAYLLHGPRGTDMDGAAARFAAALLGSSEHRVSDESHPDLYVVEPEGEAILIDQIRALRTDLHLRPFEAERRVYLLRECETLGRDAGNALLKSLEEPPPYAVFILLCNDRARLLPTIESRCQPVRFRTPSPEAIATALGDVPDAGRLARVARGDLELARRIASDPEARRRFDRYAELATLVVLDAAFDAADAAAEVVAFARQGGDAAEQRVNARRDAILERIPAGRAAARETKRVRTQHDLLAKRRRRRAETDELRSAVDATIGIWRDVLLVSVGATASVISSERLAALEALAERAGQAGAEKVLRAAQDVRRSLDLPVIPTLATERLFHEIALGVRVLTS
jgi:DNA polymerase-3 subunit delta'